MGLSDYLRILQSAEGSPALLTLATVELVHQSLSEDEQARVKDALLAAAVPHWCDPEFLAAVLETSPDDGKWLLDQLNLLTVVEPFPARGGEAVNVHEAARLALRQYLRTTDAQRWLTFSSRAEAHVSRQMEPHARIEALYHLFAIDQEAAATACEALDREFTDSGRPDVRHALVIVLRELTTAGWLRGAARVEALLASLSVRIWRGEAAQLEPDARAALEVGKASSHQSGVGRASAALGDALHAKGRLDEAMAAYREHLAIVERLAASDPENVGWQRERSYGFYRVGDIHRAQGDLDQAHEHFSTALAHAQRAAAANASSIAWQREVGVAFDRLGLLALAGGRLDEALSSFTQALLISQRVAATDSSNTDWQRDLGIAHSRVGDVFERQQDLDAALRELEASRTVSKGLAAIDPTNADWQRELGVGHARVGDVLKSLNRIDKALEAFRESFSITERLASADPSNVERQRDLALAHGRLGAAFTELKDEKNAQQHFRQAVEIMARTVALSPENPNLSTDLESLKTWLRPETNED